MAGSYVVSHLSEQLFTVRAANHAARRILPRFGQGLCYRMLAQRTGMVSSGNITTCTFFCITQLSVRRYSGT